MDSTAKPAPAGADEVVLVGGDSKPNADYERIVREELARVQERLSQLAPVGRPAAAPPEVKVAPAAPDMSSPGATALGTDISAFRAADIRGLGDGNGHPPRKRGLARVLIGLLLAGTIVGAGAAWAAYGETVRPMVANWAPDIGRQLGEAWSQVSERLGISREPEPGATSTQTATADPAAMQASTQQASTPQASDAATSQTPAAPVASAPADVGQMLQGMARDIASLQQGIDQLKAGQEQMARDNAKLAEQLKASQEQLSRVMARTAEASLHPRPVPTVRPAATAVHRPPPPVTSLPPPQAIAPPPQTAASAAPPPIEDAPLPGGPRPPKPVP